MEKKKKIKGISKTFITKKTVQKCLKNTNATLLKYPIISYTMLKH